MTTNEIIINKMVINIGTGSDSQVQPNAKRLLEVITGRKPADEISRKRNPSFKITKGQKIGAFVTLRGKAVAPVLTRLLDARNNKIPESSISGNAVSFGIKEYIEISGLKYDPKIGMLGMNVNISFKRNGVRVAERKRQQAHVPEYHRAIQKEEIATFLREKFKVDTNEESAV